MSGTVGTLGGASGLVLKNTSTTINNLQRDRSRQRLTPLPLANGQRIQGLETPHLRAGVTNVLF